MAEASQSRDDAINNLAGSLTTAVGRVCIDMLRVLKARRERYPGTWLPEPVLGAGDGHDPEHQLMLADPVGMALLVVLESLQRAERLAFVLHDMFAVPFEEIAAIIDKSPASARQLASRARRRVQGSSAVPDPTGRRTTTTAAGTRLPGPSGLRCCLHSPMIDSHMRWITSRGPAKLASARGPGVGTRTGWGTPAECERL